MIEQGANLSGGPLARIRAARRRVALIAGPESPRAKSLTLGALVILTGVITLLTSVAGTAASPPLALAVPIMLGGLLLDRPAIRALVLVGGDFLVSTLSDHGKRLELALVDVSGKGLDAGTRALLLSGALGGLLGAVAPERFLSAANEYLVRQEWDEGFATAMHVTIDLSSGHFRLTNAGHPPAAHYAGGSGRWTLVNQDGMVLGLEPDVQFGVAEGHLARYDALLLYTDGLVEVPGRDLALGIDKMLGAAEGLIPRGFEGGAERIVDTVAPQGSDDRAVVLIWRS